MKTDKLNIKKLQGDSSKFSIQNYSFSFFPSKLSTIQIGRVSTIRSELSSQKMFFQSIQNTYSLNSDY